MPWLTTVSRGTGDLRDRRYPTYPAYLGALDRVALAKVLPPADGDPYPHGAAQAILLAVDDLNTADPGRLARRLLDQLAVPQLTTRATSYGHGAHSALAPADWPGKSWT